MFKPEERISAIYSRLERGWNKENRMQSVLTPELRNEFMIKAVIEFLGEVLEVDEI
jgi:hypothetical protein